MSEHTKGPWLDRGRYGNYQREVMSPDKEHSIATVWTRRNKASVPGERRNETEPHEESIANFHLVLNAPGLLALAEHIDAMADDAYLIGHPEWVEIAEEAEKVLALVKERE